MPRHFPTRKLGVYGKFDLNPEKAVEKYFESKHQNQFYIKKPVWDCPRDGFELAGIQNDRELLAVQKEQEEMRKEAKIIGKMNEKRLADIGKVQEGLKQQFIGVNEFIQSCQAKESDANIKIDIEKDRQEILVEEIQTMTDEVKELNEFEEVLKEAVDKFKPYEEIVQEVVKQSEQFESVDDLMAKCDALLLAQAEISTMEQEKIKIVEEIRQKIVKATNDAAQVILNLDNELDELERSYNVVKQESLKWEKILADTKNHISENELITNRLMNSISQVYKLLCKRNDVEPVYTLTEPEQELDYIKEEIGLLQKITILARQKVAKENNSSQAEEGTKNKVVNAYLMKG